MPPRPPTIAFVTAGAAGMYCGSCMHDNTLARALSKSGIDIQLIPTYTPLRTDEESVAIDRVFFGGINVYLEQVLPGYRWLAPVVGPWLDRPWLLRWATRRASATSARSLGELTVSMLRGAHGRQRREVEQLCRWLERELRPDLVVFSNVLIAGCAPELKRRLEVPLLVTLQGDDVFLNDLPESFRRRALDEVQRLASSIDGFLVHSHFYADAMSELLNIPREQFHRVPLGIDLADFPWPPGIKDPQQRRPTIGYLARLTPEKGLHLLVDAFLALRTRKLDPAPRLRVAGYLGAAQHGYAEDQWQRLRAAGLEGEFEYVGSVDRAEKVRFLHSLDVLSVPTTYRDPKGLFVLEALAAGVPVVQPAHGAFPELLGQLGGGLLVPPHDPQALADGLQQLLSDAALCRTLASRGRAALEQHHRSEQAAAATWNAWRSFLPQPAPALP